MEVAYYDSALKTDLHNSLSQISRLREAHRIREALSALETLKPQYLLSGVLWQEIARCHEAMGQNQLALQAYRQAVAHNDALSESWTRLISLCELMGLRDERDEAQRCAAKLASLPAELIRASFLLNEGQIDAAEETARAYLRINGPHADGMRILAQVAIKLNVIDDAETLLEHVLELDPDNDGARFELASVLLQRRYYLRARQEVQRLLGRDSENALYQLLYGAICEGLGNAEEAIKFYRYRYERDPTDSGLLVSIGQAMKIAGDSNGAVKLFRQAARSARSLPSASLALANTKTYCFSPNEIAAMQSAEDSTTVSLVDRYQLCFALGKAFEDEQQYELSFTYYTRGNALKRAESKSDSEVVRQTMLRQEVVCTSQFFEARRGLGCPKPDPIFILGMPRAGSTLLEQILASHSQIDGTMELPDIPRLAHRFRNRDRNAPPRYPAILRELSAEELRLLGETYLRDTQIFRRDAPYFIDKMPSNFRDIGLIHLILPNAKIIDARREPMACCFGNFKQLFTKGMEFNYSLQEIGDYYCSYVRLMNHWERVLPGKILRVQHEDVVHDLEGSVRRMLDFLNLPFEPACLEFYKTERAVRTVSSEQVRRPIYREGLEQWRNFEPWLQPLKLALAPLGKD